MLELRSDEWIEKTIENNDLPGELDFSAWTEAHETILIDEFFMAQYKPIQHEIMCEIEGLMILHDISPITEPVKRGAKVAGLLVAYLMEFVADMMHDFDCKHVEREE